jgi:hypothetical protein
MSALGQKPTFAPQKVMSALPPKADIIALPTRDFSVWGPGGRFKKVGPSKRGAAASFDFAKEPEIFSGGFFC